MSELVDRLKRAADDIALGTAFHNQMAVGLGRRALTEAIAEIERLEKALKDQAHACDRLRDDRIQVMSIRNETLRGVVERVRNTLASAPRVAHVNTPGYPQWVRDERDPALAIAEEALR